MRPLDEVTGIIVDSAYRLHTRLGPGLLENVYKALLARMLEEQGLLVERQKPISFTIDGLRFKDGFRVDLLVEQSVVVELKAIDKLSPVHSRQLLGYLRLMDVRVGLLINFGEVSLKNGLQRIVNRYRPSA
jgi:GxxExxY protein